MSLKLLKNLNGNSKGELYRFIKRFDDEKKEPRIAWYPSAGDDFRPLLYLSTRYINSYPAQGFEPLPPELFLFTDYFPWESGKFLDTQRIYSDLITGITVKSIEELPKLNLPISEKLVHFPKGSIATNRVVFMTIEVYSDKLGMFTMPVLYCFAENTAFCCELLLKSKAHISHVVHVRYGGGMFGGGNASGAWILRALKLLGAEVFITDSHHLWQGGDSIALEICGILATQQEPKFSTIRKLDGKKWSEHGDVSWNLIQV